MTTRRGILSWLTACLLLLPAAACDGDHSYHVSSTDGTGYVYIHLTDAPLDIDTVQSVNVTLDSVEVFRAASIASDEEKIELLPRAATFDLLTLTNGITTLLAAGDLPAGYYTKIRLGISAANLVFKDQTESPARIDSNKVDINLPFEIATSESLVVTLDFDAAASLHVVLTGSDRYILRPVVTGVAGSDPDPVPLPGDPNMPADPNMPSDPNAPAGSGV